MRAPKLLTLVTSLGLALVACGDDKPRRALGQTCGDSSECAEGVCGGGLCLDPAADDDFDGLINGTELSLGTNPVNADSDNDALRDKDELDAGLGLLDIDGDGIPDVLESQGADDDGDCLPNQFDPQNEVENSDLTGLIPVVCRRVGVCAATETLAVSCPGGAGSGTCDYGAVPSFEAEERSCDGLDNDCDGVTDDGAEDIDGDGLAGCVDNDDDGDGVGASDNCPKVSNADQADGDGDGDGDACDGPTPPTVLSVAPGLVGNDPTPTFGGVADAGATVVLFDGEACLGESASASADASGHFEVTLEVSEGPHAVSLLARNGAGLESVCVRSAFGYTLDVTGPATAAFERAEPPSPSTVATPFVAGTAEVGGTVRCYDGPTCEGAPAGMGDALDGRFSFGVALAGPGSHAIHCQVVDLAGNVSPCAELTTYVVEDGELPAPRPVSGPFDPGSPSSARTVALTGCRPEGLAVDLFFEACSAGDPVARVGASDVAVPDVACLSGEVGFEMSLLMPTNVVTTVLGRATSTAGTTSGCAVLGLYEHDNEPPAKPTIVGFAPPGPSASPMVEVLVTAEPFARVDLYAAPNCAGPHITGVADALGDARIAFAAATSGTFTFSARASDRANNASVCAASKSWVRDAEPPATPSPHPVPFTPASPTSATRQPVVKVCTVSDSVALFTSNGCAGPALATLSGSSADGACPSGRSVSETVELPANQRTLLFGRSTSTTGVNSACAWLGEFVHDDIAPNAPELIETVPTSPGADATPIIRGRTTPQSIVSLHPSGACAGATLGEGQAGDDGGFAIAASVPDNATTSLYAVARDAAGNRSPCTLLTSYTHDDRAPEAPRLPRPLVSPQGRPTVDVRGCAERGSRVTLYEDAGCEAELGNSSAQIIDFDCGGTDIGSTERAFEVNVIARENKSLPIFGRAEDAASNLSSCVGLGTYFFDAAGPAAPVAEEVRSTASEDTRADFRVSGLAEARGAVRVLQVPAGYVVSATETCEGDELGANAVDDDGRFSVDFSVRTDAPVEVAYQPLDEFGNPGPCAGPVTVVGEAFATAHDFDGEVAFVDPDQQIVFGRPDGSIIETFTLGARAVADRGPGALVYPGCFVTTGWESPPGNEEMRVVRTLDTLGIGPDDALVLERPQRSQGFFGYYGSVMVTVAPLGTYQQLFSAHCNVGTFYEGVTYAGLYGDCVDASRCIPEAGNDCATIEFKTTFLAVAYGDEGEPIAYTTLPFTYYASGYQGDGVAMPGWQTGLIQTEVTLTSAAPSATVAGTTFEMLRNGNEVRVAMENATLYASSGSSMSATFISVPGYGDGWQVQMGNLTQSAIGDSRSGAGSRTLYMRRGSGTPPASVVVDGAVEFSQTVGPRDEGDFSDPDRPRFSLLEVDGVDAHDFAATTMAWIDVDQRLLWRLAQPAWQARTIPFPELPASLALFRPTANGDIDEAMLTIADFDFADDYTDAVETLGAEILGIFNETSRKFDELLPPEFVVRASAWISGKGGNSANAPSSGN
jgi:hypothetical protein